MDSFRAKQVNVTKHVESGSEPFQSHKTLFNYSTTRKPLYSENSRSHMTVIKRPLGSAASSHIH